MAIYKSDIVDINLETGSIHRSFIKHTIGTADQNADRFGVRVFRNGEAVDLSGCSCYGYFQNSNGDNIALTSAGTVDGNVAYVTLPQACYNYEGNFCLAIKLLISGVTSTVRIVDGVVDNTNTGSAVAPTDAVPSYSEILDQYDAMVAATAVANGAIATTFNAATVYPAGSYVINNGALYRITADHAANVTWANTSKVATNFGAEVTGLKSALKQETDRSMTDRSCFRIGEYAPYEYRDQNIGGIALTMAPGILKLNGTSTSGRHMSLLGSKVIYATGSSVSEEMLQEGPFSVTQGHTYRLSSKLVSGNISSASAVIFYIWDTNGTELVEAYFNNDIEFTAESNTIGQVTMYFKKNVTYSNAVIVYEIKDITDEIAEEAAQKQKELKYRGYIGAEYADADEPVKPGQLCFYNDLLYYRVNYSDEVEESFTSARWRSTDVSKMFSDRTTAIDNNFSAFFGGVCGIPFEQGSASISSGYLTPSNNSRRARTRFDMLPFFMKGDIISIAEGFRYILTYVKITKSGIAAQDGTGWQTGNYTLAKTSLAFIYVEKTDGTSTITPAEAEEALTITHYGYEFGKVRRSLKQNPYQNIPWDAVQDVTSVCHAHMNADERLQTQFENLQAKYDHLAISMYYPSVPYYPLEAKFSNVGNTLGSPNAEHVRMTGESGHLHLCAVGSYLATNPDSTSPYIHVGELENVVIEAENSMKGNGGGLTINHPRWSGLTVEKILSIMAMSERVIALEVWNASCEMSNNTGDSSELWDGVLSTGNQIFATAVPDHECQYHPEENRCGFGYNHMLVVNKTEDEILTAYRNGRFYTTLYNDGLLLEGIEIASGTVSIEVSEAAIFKFITATRTVTTESASTAATFATQDGDVYVRVEVTRGTNKLWTNAIIL